MKHINLQNYIAMQKEDTEREKSKHNENDKRIMDTCSIYIWRIL